MFSFGCESFFDVVSLGCNLGGKLYINMCYYLLKSVCPVKAMILFVLVAYRCSEWNNSDYVKLTEVPIVSERGLKMVVVDLCWLVRNGIIATVLQDTRS